MLDSSGESQQAQLHTIIEGRVQGVGFRAFVEMTAIDLGLTGWVRNRWNGAVEVLAEGDRSSLEKLLAAVHRGPRASNVTQVTSKWLPASGEFAHFTVRRTE